MTTPEHYAYLRALRTAELIARQRVSELDTERALDQSEHIAYRQSSSAYNCEMVADKIHARIVSERVGSDEPDWALIPRQIAPEALAKAWKAFKGERGMLSIGAGPAFSEGIKALVEFYWRGK